MKPKVSQLAAAAAIVGFLGFGGVSLAYAQDSTTTQDPSTTTAPDSGSTTTAPDSGSTTTPGHSDANCPNMGEGGGGRGPRASNGETPSQAPATEAPAESSSV